MRLTGGNELANLIYLSLVGLRIVTFKKVSGIYRLCKNEVTLEIARIEIICRVA